MFVREKIDDTSGKLLLTLIIVRTASVQIHSLSFENY